MRQNQIKLFGNQWCHHKTSVHQMTSYQASSKESKTRRYAHLRPDASRSVSGLKSPTTTISTRELDAGNGTSTICDELPDQQRSTPRTVWCEQHDGLSGKREQASVNLVVTGKVFPKVKFVDRDTQLMYSTEKHSICQFVISECNLQPEVTEELWWKTAKIYVGAAINRLRNDRNTAMKWATFGKQQS